jgi:hypothetical protein
MYVYRALACVGVRTKPNVTDASRDSDSVREGGMVAIDLRQPSAYPTSTNGPFLRLASYNGGWLFETKNGEPMMEEVPTEKGLWALQVLNKAGMALREHPADYPTNLVSPQISYPDGFIIYVDLKVKAKDGVVFYRVQGTRGWVFSNRGSHAMTQEVEVQDAVSLCRPHVPNNPASTYGIPVELVRELARQHDLEEIQFNPQSRIVSFSQQTDDGPVRINVYYSTGTVGTALDHPVQGPTQLFRRRCTVGELNSIMSDLRWHSGRGHRRRRKNEDSVDFAFCEADTVDVPPDEAHALWELLQEDSVDFPISEADSADVPPDETHLFRQSLQDDSVDFVLCSADTPCDETHALRMLLQEADAELIELQARRNRLAKQVTGMDMARYDAAVEQQRCKEKAWRDEKLKLKLT